ncbi:Ribosomal RNA small subunit methyltransferase F [bioreactor metagenome]|uniref:Ribosomal RNA small subunit methyltransferase F n=2 Tax=root TaxID=1 RepID=A0A645DVE3_9ZZZZ
MKSNNDVPPLTIRINKLKTNKQEVIDDLEGHGIACSEGLYNEEAVSVRGTSSIESLEIFNKGFFSVQDESSMLVSKVMNPKPDSLIIDVCSAPGGKAAHMAELMDNKGLIIARDIHQHKLDLINKACSRLGINIVKTQLFDALSIDKAYIGAADGVLVDAPCSGLGLLRRKPDLRWKKKPDDLDSLSNIQYEILKNASLYVKKGGALIYSTCTLNKNENIEIVKKFLAANDGFYLDNIENLIPQNLYAPDAKEGYLELFPHIHNTDGFFIARLIKR